MKKQQRQLRRQRRYSHFGPWRKRLWRIWGRVTWILLAIPVAWLWLVFLMAASGV